jgi:hypothetical protein
LGTPEIEAYQGTVNVGQVTDHLSGGRRSLPDDRWQGDGVLLSCESWILHQVDDFDLVASGKVRFTDLLEIAEGSV